MKMLLLLLILPMSLLMMATPALFYMLESYLTKVLGIKSDDEFPSTSLDFIHSFGALNCLISDNAKAELSSAVKKFLCHFQITA
jgi:hypothetical protein